MMKTSSLDVLAPLTQLNHVSMQNHFMGNNVSVFISSPLSLLLDSWESVSVV